MTLHGCFATECAGISCVLRDFDLLDLFAEGGTVATHAWLVSMDHTFILFADDAK